MGAADVTNMGIWLEYWIDYFQGQMAIERNFKNSYNHIEDTFWKEVIVFITRRQSFPYAINFFFFNFGGLWS